MRLTPELASRAQRVERPANCYALLTTEIFMEWQPIETYEYDGNEVLAAVPMYNEPGRGHFVTVAHLSEGKWYDNSGSIWTPTHWMPLPEPPACA